MSERYEGTENFSRTLDPSLMSFSEFKRKLAMNLQPHNGIEEIHQEVLYRFAEHHFVRLKSRKIFRLGISAARERLRELKKIEKGLHTATRDVEICAQIFRKHAFDTGAKFDRSSLEDIQLKIAAALEDIKHIKIAEAINIPAYARNKSERDLVGRDDEMAAFLFPKYSSASDHLFFSECNDYLKSQKIPRPISQRSRLGLIAKIWELVTPEAAAALITNGTEGHLEDRIKKGLKAAKKQKLDKYI